MVKADVASRHRLTAWGSFSGRLAEIYLKVSWFVLVTPSHICHAMLSYTPAQDHEGLYTPIHMCLIIAVTSLAMMCQSVIVGMRLIL